MTKHLRFLFVMLLAMIWSAGWAQTTVDFSNGLPTDWSKTGTIQKYTYDSKSGIQLQKNTSITSPAFEDAYSSMKLSLKRSSNATTFTISYQIGNASAVVFKTFKAADVAQKSWNDCTIGIPAAAQVANCKFIFTSATSSYYISSIEFTPAGPTKTATNVSFGANTGNTFTFTEGEYTDGTFTAPTATETKGIEGTIVYSSDNESAVKVNASIGALSFPGYGEATITATFTPTDTETYAVSTDSYKVINNQKVDESVIVFSAEAKSFESIVTGKDGYDGNKGKIDFIATNGKKYTFYVQRALKNNGKLQLNKSTVTSPAFSDFTNGYKVTIEYETSKATITLSSASKSVKGSSNDKTISLDVQDGSAFKINITSNVLYISKIEIVPNKVGITLDENSESNTIEAKTGVNVTLKRSMVKGEWNTICLPFEVSEKQAKDAFGEGVKIATLNKKSTGTTISFEDISILGIPASEPCLIKPSIDYPAEGYIFKDVTIAEGAIEPMEDSTDDSSFGFVGIYNKTDISTGIENTIFKGEFYAAFLGAGNKIYKTDGSGNKTKGFRAYFAIPKSASASALRVVIDGTATSIKNIDSEVVESNAPVYNLQGQRVDGNNLTPGIYVKAGKKFVVK